MKWRFLYVGKWRGLNFIQYRFAHKLKLHYFKQSSKAYWLSTIAATFGIIKKLKSARLEAENKRSAFEILPQAKDPEGANTSRRRV